MKRSCIKEIRDQTQKRSIRLKALSMVPFPLPLVRTWGWWWHQSYRRKQSRFATWTYRGKQSEHKSYRRQRTKPKEKNAECALYRCERLHCGVAAWQVASSNRWKAKGLPVDKFQNVLTQQQGSSRSPFGQNWGGLSLVLTSLWTGSAKHTSRPTGASTIWHQLEDCNSDCSHYIIALLMR